MITVVNRNHYQGEGVHIGPQSPLANPYTVGKDGSRAAVNEKYRFWLLKQLESDVHNKQKAAIAKLQASTDVVLVCFCKPHACHGDVIKELLESTTW